MKNLRVFIFQQHWFHLASLLEAIVQKNSDYHSIEFYYINKSLFVKPLDRHQDFYGSRLFTRSGSSPLRIKRSAASVLAAMCKWAYRAIA